MARPCPWPATGVRTVLSLVLGMRAMGAGANGPTAVPENAVEVRLGWAGLPTVVAGAEMLVPVRYVDASAAVDVAVATDGRLAARLSGTALLFPTLGTTPPLALGVGADVGWRDDAVRAHLGPVLGLDLLYVSPRLPAVIEAYVAPGYAFGEGASLAWSAEARWYRDDVAFVLGSSDLAPLGLGVRVPF